MGDKSDGQNHGYVDRDISKQVQTGYGFTLRGIFDSSVPHEGNYGIHVAQASKESSKNSGSLVRVPDIRSKSMVSGPGRIGYHRVEHAVVAQDCAQVAKKNIFRRVGSKNNCKKSAHKKISTIPRGEDENVDLQTEAGCHFENDDALEFTRAWIQTYQRSPSYRRDTGGRGTKCKG